MTVLYDNLNFNREILLDLPFREGVGAITQDVAKPHHPVTLVNTPTWTTLDSGLSVITLDGDNDYLRCLNADSADLGFTTGDYSIGGWFKWSAGDDSQIVIGRYQLDVGGWELYIYDSPNYYLTLRHHHAGGAAVRTGAYSTAWVPNVWHFFGISRTGGGQAVFHRDGVALTTVSTLEDPEATTSNLLIGVRYTANDNNFKGPLWRLRAWPRLVTASEWLTMYKHERRWLE